MPGRISECQAGSVSARQDEFPEHRCRNPSLAITGWINFGGAPGGEFHSIGGMSKCAAEGTARTTEASTSKGATIERERAMTLRYKESDA